MQCVVKKKKYIYISLIHNNNLLRYSKMIVMMCYPESWDHNTRKLICLKCPFTNDLVDKPFMRDLVCSLSFKATVLRDVQGCKSTICNWPLILLLNISEECMQCSGENYRGKISTTASGLYLPALGISRTQKPWLHPFSVRHYPL